MSEMCAIETLLRWAGAVLFVYGALLVLWRRLRRPHFEQLYRAVELGDLVGALCLLRRYPHYINRFRRPAGYTPFMVACAHGRTPLVKAMLRLGADLQLKSAHQETALQLAAFYYIRHQACKDASCIHALCHAGADVNEPGGPQALTPLELAAMFGHAALVKWLLAKGARPPAEPQRHPYLLARAFGHQDTARLIAHSMHLKQLGLMPD
ncbi:hypothetical protein HUJ04_000114 [Dendroctonus ponderosae]|nr:hypothetical protein HUJ04_000114 [Dendroctonus ponderosae]